MLQQYENIHSVLLVTKKKIIVYFIVKNLFDIGVSSYECFLYDNVVSDDVEISSQGLSHSLTFLSTVKRYCKMKKCDIRMSYTGYVKKIIEF